MARTGSEEATRQILAIGGGGFSEEQDVAHIEDFLLGLADAAVPRICFVPTASGDADEKLLKFYRFFSNRACEPSHLPLFRHEHDDVREFILSQDVMFVGGGSTANLLAIWRTHGIDEIICDAYNAGVVLAGVSAGAMCWFEGCVTRSLGTELAALQDGFGLLEGSACPHYDSQKRRRPLFQGAIAAGFPSGYGIDDGAALHFVEGELAEVVAARPSAAAYRVDSIEGKAVETTLPARYLGEG